MRDFRYIIGFFVTIGLIIIALILILHGGNGGNGANPVKTPIDLANYANTNAVATLIIDSPITAAEDHKKIEIDVSNSSATFTEYGGYDGQVIRSKTYPMSTNSYDVFLRSLRQAGFTEGNDDEKLADERGFCPTGDRYIYEFSQGSNTLARYWSTSCGGTKTYNGNAPLTRTLFIQQIPDYDDLTQDFND